jgi:2-oxo-3-hexenedioate decarboxylase/2-keto-4-pentenoate hydratase
VTGPTRSFPQRTAPYELSPETEQVAAIADLVAEHRVARTALTDLPENLRPISFEPVEAIMHALHRRLPWETVGWKVGAASAEVQRLERLPGPVPGRLHQRGLYTSGDHLPASTFINHRNTECEFAFELVRDLPSRPEPYTFEDLSDAVGDLIPVFEIGDSVFPDWYGASQYYGPCLDNGGGAALVMGERVHAWRDHDLSTAAIDLFVNGEHRRQGFGSAAMGHPLHSLAWMANWTSSYGIDLTAGEIVSSGTCTSHCFAAQGDVITADFGPFGRIEIAYELPDRAE